MYTAIVISAVVVATALGVIAWASFSIGAGVWVGAWCRACTTRKVVALTFDDGPHPDGTPKVLDVLAKHGVKAAFFVTGERAGAHPEIVRRMAEDGHLVGNHTYSHSGRFPFLGRRKMREEMLRCDEVVEKATGTRPTLFRPPFGVTNPPLAKVVREGGYTVAGWSVRSLDTIARWPREKVLDRIRCRMQPGSVVLLHDDRPQSDALLEMILTHLEKTGYEVERFDKLFGSCERQ
jgi:peptidoglycan/xylan/chitin deacetylase (PgdA/CDA1 family)